MQIWQILISKADNQSTITYGELADYLGFAGAGVFAPLLDCIMRYCDKNGLPPLTSLVVNKTTGVPGDGLTTIKNLPLDQQAVFEHKWFAMYPVQITDFKEFS
ncbi:MAG: hypothetical protein M0R41_01515 [Methylobacter tundripaludum]|nr:hypothetical protein [Methylobacter tundripaludum]MCK9634943.1 hypothetical protein [Methylobacter tundripaludum]